MFNRFSAGSVRPTGGAGGTSPRRSRARRTLTSIVSLTALSVAMMLPATAFGLGNNGPVYRSCGVNYVSSGYVSSGYSWAQTRKISGSCAGRLSAGLQYNGYRTRVYGSSQNAYTSNWGYARNGLHWGCDSCNITYS